MSRYIFLFNLDAFFKQGFLQQMELLRKIPVSEARRMVGEIQLNGKMAAFIKKNRDRCYIVTECPDVWLEDIMDKLGMTDNIFSSKATVKDDYIQDVISIVDKNAVVNQVNLPFAAVGNGDDDAGMIVAAEIGIGYGGVRSIAPAVLACASHAVYEEDKLVDFLERLV